METQWEVPLNNCWEKNTVCKKKKIAPGSAPPKRIQNDDEVLRARSETKVEETCARHAGCVFAATSIPSSHLRLTKGGGCLVHTASHDDTAYIWAASETEPCSQTVGLNGMAIQNSSKLQMKDLLQNIFNE